MARATRISTGGVRADGAYYESPQYYYAPYAETLKAIAKMTGQTEADIASQFKNWTTNSATTYNNLIGGDPATWANTYNQWSPDTMMAWLQKNTPTGQDALKYNITDPADQLLANWRAQYAPTLQRAVEQGRGAFLTSAGDIGAGSKLVDANLEAQYQNKYADWLGAATQAATEPFTKGAQMGYQGYMDKGQAMAIAQLQAAADAQRALWGTLLQSTQGQMYSPQVQRTSGQTPNVMSLESPLDKQKTAQRGSGSGSGSGATGQPGGFSQGVTGLNPNIP